MKLSYCVSLQKTGFSAIGQGDWKDTLKYMHKLGYQGAELAIKDPFKANIPEIRETLIKTNLKLIAIGTGQAYHDNKYSMIDDNPAVRKKVALLLKKHVDIASQFGAMVIIGYIHGRLKEQKDKTKAYERFEESIIEIDQYAEKKGVTISIEPLNRYEVDYLNKVEDIVTLIDECGLKSTGILMDTFHMNIEEPKWHRTIYMGAKYVKHVHLADSNRELPGAGHLNFSEILGMFRDIGYNGYYSGEMIATSDLKHAITRYLNFMKGVLHERI